MPAPEPEETFKVTDRRRRASEDDTSPSLAPEPPRETVTPPPAAVEDEGDSLTGLFGMLANSAAMALGDGDPGQASELIEILALLRRKTEGNRTAEETQVLDELIYELQVRYVEVMKPSG
jgi:hypothetical protein